MNRLSQDRINSLLNDYLDGALNDADRKIAEELITSDDAVSVELDRLKRMRELLAGQNRIEPDVAFWTRLSARLSEEDEDENLLPFPRRHFPAAVLVSFVGILLIGSVIFENRMSLLHFVTQKSQIVQSVYEEGIMKGSILPLLSHIDNNQVLQFSLLGVLPLDAKEQTSLKVDQNSANGYQIKLDKTPSRKSKPITVKDFYAEIQATDQQKDVIDSLFALARRRIESSVLVSENNAVAIDPGLAQLNRVMVSNIASSLEPFQRIRFGRFLERKDAPYSFVSKKFVPANPESIYVEMSRVPANRRFVVVTADSLTYAHFDPEALRHIRQNTEISNQIAGIAQRNLELTERLLRRFAVREPRPENIPQVIAPPFEIWKDENAVGIRFQRDVNDQRWEIRQPVVVPVQRHMRIFSVVPPDGSLELGVYGDSVTPGEGMIDSAIGRFFNRNNSADYNLKMMDSIFASLSLQFQIRRGAFPLDSIFHTLQEARRRAFEERRRNHPLIQKEIQVKKDVPPPHIE
jgi:hypothetical protein